MNKIYLKAIDKSNWEEAIKLSVTEEQQTFIASNL
ncbi:TPA: GNAT family N-acetyltransferase, partial [Bacillus thuringiensis]